MRRTLEDLLAEARTRIDRPTPEEAAKSGAQIIDIRTVEQRRADGTVPGSLWFARNVLEWRVDPESDARDERVAPLDAPVIVMCDAGYASSLAAATLVDLGFTHAGDMDGGFQAWKAAGLPTEPLAD